jgi:hypothetical protein
MSVLAFPIVDDTLFECCVQDGISWLIDRFNAVPVSNECPQGRT